MLYPVSTIIYSVVFGLDIDIDTDPQTLAAEIIIIIIHSAIKKYSYLKI